MKKLTGISLFIFFVVTTAVLSVGLLSYQNNKNGFQPASNTTNTTSTTLVKLASSGITTLSMAEVAKHNTVPDCWMVINGKVYDLSRYASLHPGGAMNIADYCGKEATAAFDTKGGRGSPHSGNANAMLVQYYLGDLNQKVDPATLQQTVQKINSTPLPPTRGGDDEFDD